jgi:L-lactate utilization protein LutC
VEEAEAARMSTNHDDRGVIERVRRALGRTAPLATPPVPPAIEEPVTRLVYSDLGLPELFAKRAADLKMLVTPVYPEELIPQLTKFLLERYCKRVVLANSKLLDGLSVVEALREAGFDARRWGEITLDELYDFDCGITDVHYAVAESGSLVIRTSADHGRGLSLVPMFHVAVVEPKNFLPDLVDLFDKLAVEARETPGTNYVIISGPSKTADIEMNVVTGVHGPNVVQAFVLQ